MRNLIIKIFLGLFLSTILLNAESQINKNDTLVSKIKELDNKSKVFVDEKNLNTTVLTNIIAKLYNLNPNIVSIYSVDFEKDLNLHKVLFKISSETLKNFKGLLFVNDKGYIITGGLFSEDGVNIFEQKFIEANKEEIDKQVNKINEENNNIKLENKKFLDDLSMGKYGDIVRIIKGNQNKTEVMYLFTDLKCPFCKLYEDGERVDGEKDSNFGLNYDLTQYKEIRVIMYPLYMLRGHETSIQRSLWFYNKTKNIKDPKKMLELMKQASNDDISNLKVDEKELLIYDNFVKDREKGLMSTETVKGTPSMFLEDGTKLNK